MLRERTTRYSENALLAIVWTATGVSALIGGCLKVDEKRFVFPSIIAGILHVRASAWWSLPLTTMLAGGGQKLRSWLGSHHQWKTVQVLLDHYREETFGKNEHTKDDPQHYHRITIFKHTNFRITLERWPWSGWMIPVARSGFATKSKIRCFRASLDKPEKAEGVAGRSFVNGKIIAIKDLPSLTTDRTNEDDVKRYSERTFIPKSKLDNRYPSACSLVGIPLEVNGKPWGSIVLDSHNPREIPHKKAVYSTLIKVLNEILQ